MYVRNRLAISFALIMAGALAALSFGVYQLTRHNLLAEIQRDAGERAELLAAAARPGPGKLEPRSLEIDAFSAPDVFVQILDAGGATVARSVNLEGRDLPFDPRAAETEAVQEVHVGGLPLFQSTRAVVEGSTTIGYVIVARSPLAVYLALDRMRRLLYPAAAAALVVTAGAGWLLSRRAMRPLERVGSSAARIAETQDHTARVGYRGPSNEIGRLARTIDGMLDALEVAHRQVSDAHESERRFLAEVSHELRTPLTIMLSSLDLLARVGEADPEFVAQTLDGLRAETERMARMVTQLLMMARAGRDESGSRTPILVADVLEDACRQSAANGNGVTLVWPALEELDDAVVAGNTDYLKQLFLILLDNAMKYTPPGGRVEVQTTTDEATVSIAVADTGIGIPAEEVDRIFDRFYRGAAARSQDGTGLGLAIARHIVDQHGGDIDVRTEPGKGSRFRITLPRIA